MQEGPSSISGLGRYPRGGHGNPLQYFDLEKPHGQRNLTGYSPWGRKELDATEQLWRKGTIYPFEGRVPKDGRER